MNAKVLIGGDVYTGGHAEQLLAENNVSRVFGDVLPLIQSADLTLVNLEAPLTDESSPSVKTGPILRAKTATASGLHAAGVNVVGLANNHIMDHGPSGMRSTLIACQKANLAVVGGGKNIADASKLYIQNINGVRVAIAAYADHEWSLASESEAGANPFDVRQFVRTVRENRELFDRLIVLYHGGREYHPWPTPELQDDCRFLIEEGADAVICQHSHCIGAYEKYLHGCIVYGQGNFLFEKKAMDQKGWERGYLVMLNMYVEGSLDFDIVLTEQKNGYVRLMEEGLASQVKQQLKESEVQIQHPEFVKQKWEERCSQDTVLYYNILKGTPRFIRALCRCLGISRGMYSKKTRRYLLNALRCRAHYEEIITLLEKD